MAMALEFDQLTQRLTAHLDASEVEHALRHLAIEPKDLWLLEQQVPDKFASQAPPPDRSFELWTSEATGGRTLVAAGLTQRDAQCWLEEIEDDDANQRAWVQRAKVGSTPSERDDVDDLLEDLADPIRQQLIHRFGRARTDADEPQE
jgi:hypothetical protein